MSNYLVISDEYGEVIPVLDYSQGPVEYGRDVCVVLGAKDKNEAKWFAVKYWRKIGAKCFDAPWQHPFKGVKVKPFPDISEYPLKTDEGEIIETWGEMLLSYDVVAIS